MWLAGVAVCLTVLLATPKPVTAGGFFETGAVTLNTTVDDLPAGWVTVNLTRSYVNPVVVAGPLTHNNGHSLFLRVRNVTAASFQIGMQSPCEETGVYQGPRPSDLGASPQPVGDPGIAWYTTWESGLAEAKRSGRPIFFMAAAATCSGISGVF